MGYLLRAFGHETLEAHDGVDGLEKASGEKPDLILLDIHMPRMDGYEVARLLRANSECSRIPIIAVTALAMVGDRERILASGFSGYIAKPLDPETFSAQVEGYLGPGRATSVRRAVRSQEPAPTQSPSPSKKVAVILFVDNTQTNLDLIKSTLEPSGYEVLVALSASEGLELAKRAKPDLIVSDVHMPRQNGYEFLHMVQEEPELSRIPFVFLSASVWSTREKQQALTCGATKFISRPIEPADLLIEIAECLHQSSGA